MANFIGFEPAEYQKKMKLLDEVIKLKARNKDAAEQAQGYQVEAAQKAARQAKPVTDELARQNALMLTYESNKDIIEAKRQLTDSLRLKNDADVVAAQTGDQGDAALAQAYGLQAEYAQSKVKLLEAMRDSIKAKKPREKSLKNQEVEDRMDEYQEALNDFMDANIPVGFIQVIDIRTIPQQPQQNPGQPQPQVNIPQPPPQAPPQIAAQKTVLEQINEWGQTGQSDMVVDFAPGPGVHFYIDKGSPSLVALYSEDLNAKVDATFTKSKKFDFNGYKILPDTMFGLLTKALDILDPDELEELVLAYSYAFAYAVKIGNNWVFDDVKFPKLAAELYAHPDYGQIEQKLQLFSQSAAQQGQQAPPKGSGIVRDVLGLARKSLTPKKQVRGPPRFKLGPSGEYGNVRVDMPALLNRGRVRVMRGGSVVLDEVEENVDGFGLSRLITKRVMQKTIDAAPPKVRKQYERLNKLAAAAAEISKNAAKTKGSGVQPKIKVVKKPENIVVVGNGAELAQRLKIATGLYVAGNRSSENVQLITELAHAMLKMGKISHERYADILETYVAE